MNFDSKILKLSIIFMLVLVLIPAVSAANSTDSTMQEYDSQGDEGFVIEYSYPEDEVDTQVDLSCDCESDGFQDVDDSSKDQISKPSNDIKDIVEVSENIEYSSKDNQDIIYNEIVEDDSELSFESSNEITYYFDDSNDDRTTLKDVSTMHASFFITEYGSFNIHSLVNIYVMKDVSNKFFFSKNLYKVYEMKNNLLINQDICSCIGKHLSYELNERLVSCMNKVNSDFAFSIDNSIVGSDAFPTHTCFLNFYHYFDADFSFNLKIVEYFFSRDFSLSSMAFFEQITCNSDLFNFPISSDDYLMNKNINNEVKE